MGLDMYLNARQFMSPYLDDKDGARINKINKMFDLKKVDHFDRPIAANTVIFEIAYWRKANAIHNYIVETHADGRDECQEIGLSRDSLHTLREMCKLAIDGYVQDNSLTFAEEHLPTTSGFFFGSTEYDEWYFRDLANTVDIIDRCLADEANDWFIYRASW